MKADRGPEKDVERELEWDPSIDAVRHRSQDRRGADSPRGATSGTRRHRHSGGCVTLTGRVDSLGERRLAFDAARLAPGVREVADRLSIA
ncbi:BON domain-containing protein [Burkholderia sp. BE17]|uniref:BON domain-containing protein n=1 Tax=Burkholderia sp. BE17 TaxID=2656644 RepID=UPI00128D23E8|nr:BON domain-containing protein [Burkholderia sp. BE17]